MLGLDVSAQDSRSVLEIFLAQLAENRWNVTCAALDILDFDVPTGIDSVDGTGSHKNPGALKNCLVTFAELSPEPRVIHPTNSSRGKGGMAMFSRDLKPHAPGIHWKSIGNPLEIHRKSTNSLASMMVTK